MTRRTQQESSWHTGLAQLVNLLQVGGRCELRTQSCRSKGTCLISLIGSPIFYKSSWCIQLWSFIWCFLCRCWHCLFSCSFRLKINPFYGKIFQLTSVTAWLTCAGWMWTLPCSYKAAGAGVPAGAQQSRGAWEMCVGPRWTPGILQVLWWASARRSLIPGQEMVSHPSKLSAYCNCSFPCSSSSWLGLNSLATVVMARYGQARL